MFATLIYRHMNVVVTGASSGIGYELVKTLAADSKVKRILAIARRDDRLAQLKKDSDSEKVYTLSADIRTLDLDAIASSGFLTDVDSIDLLVNNAGLLINKPFLEISDEDIRASYDVNVIAPVRMVRMLYPFLKSSNSSHVVNIGSMGGFQGSAKFSGLSAYSSSKGALAFYTECMAEEFKEDNVRVNCLALGAVQTEMLEKAFPGYQAPTTPVEMAEFVAWFGVNGHQQFNGKVLPASLTTP
jgi:3-oxoacyl-[acyl-carrier protein] reductase